MTRHPLEHPDLARFLEMLESRARSPRPSAGLLNEIGARGLFRILAHCVGPGEPQPGLRQRLAGSARDALVSASRSEEFEDAVFAREVGELLSAGDGEVRRTAAAIAEYLLQPPGPVGPLLQALDQHLPPDPYPEQPLTLGTFLVDRPVEPEPRGALDRLLAFGDPPGR